MIAAHYASGADGIGGNSLIAFALAECCATTKLACLIAAKPLSPVLRLAGDYRNTVAHAIDVNRTIVIGC